MIAMHWLLRSVQWILAHSTMQCVLYPVYNVYCAVHCALCTVNCTITLPLCTVHYPLHWSLHPVYNVHYTGYCTVCTVHFPVFTVHCALSTTLVTVYNVHYTGHCTLCTVHCTGHWQGGGGGGSVSATSGSFEPRPKLPVSKTVGGKTRPEIYLSPHKWIFAGEIKEFFKIIKRRERFCTKVYLSVRMRFYAKVLKPISGKIAKECKIR